MKTRTFALILSLLLSTQAFALVGGQAVLRKDFPSSLAFVMGTSMCSGTKISRTQILTAVHCFPPAQAAALAIKPAKSVFTGEELKALYANLPGSGKYGFITVMQRDKGAETFHVPLKVKRISFLPHELSLIDMAVIDLDLDVDPTTSVQFDDSQTLTGNQQVRIAYWFQGIPSAALSFEPVQKGDVILLGGFSSNGQPAGFDTIQLNMGEVAVTSDDNAVGFDLISKAVHVMEGDSGGGAYKMIDGVKTVIGVNINGDLVDESVVRPLSVYGAKAWLAKTIKK